jgi:hypothetical protein
VSDHSDDPAPDWTGGTMAQRFDDCRLLLFLHDLITQYESRRIWKRQVSRRLTTLDQSIGPRMPK